jgi:hypothetical protein
MVERAVAAAAAAAAAASISILYTLPLLYVEQ